MSSSEEYLDNLLKSLTEGGNNTGINAVSSAAQNMGRAEELQETSALEDADQTMSMDDIEAVFASMGEEAVADELQADGTVLPSDELLLDELSEELPIEEDSLSEISNLNDEVLSDGSGVEEETVTDELVLDDSILSGEPVLDDSIISDEPVMDEGMAPDELIMDEGMAPDESAIDESMMPDELILDDGGISEENLMPDDSVLDDSILFDELLLNEGASDDLELNDESVMDDLVLSDEGTVDDLMLSDEGTMDDLILSDEGVSGDMALSDEGAMDDLILSDEGVSDDLTLNDESAMDDFALNGETMSDDLGLDESASDELSLEELGLGDLGLEDLGLEERGAEDSEEPALEEESGLDMDFAIEEGEESEPIPPEGEAVSEEQFALEEAGEEDADLSALLASMGGDDDLAEINDLLEKSDQGVTIDDDMIAMLDGMSDGDDGEDAFDFFAGEEEETGEERRTEEREPENIREITPEELAERENPKTEKQKKKEEKERKKKEKKAKKAKKKDGDAKEGADELDGLPESLDEGEKKTKEPGFFAKLIDFLLEEDDEDADSAEKGLDDVGVVIGKLSDENKELLAELNAEDKAKKKDKKDKKDKKEKKDKKGKKKGGKAGAGGDGEGSAKPKKPKKEKKKKEQSIEEELKLPEKRLSKKKVVSVFLFCATIAACIVVVTMLFPEQMEKREARVAYDHGQYTQVYDLLYGKKLSEEDEVLLQKSGIVLKMQRKLDSYENYRKLDMQLEALNALIEGVSRYHNLRDDADGYNIGGEVADIYGQILVELANNYNLSETDVLDIIASDDNVTYTQRLQAVISGENYGAEEEELPDVKQDVLPGEEEIIDRLQGTETE